MVLHIVRAAGGLAAALDDLSHASTVFRRRCAERYLGDLLVAAVSLATRLDIDLTGLPMRQSTCFRVIPRSLFSFHYASSAFDGGPNSSSSTARTPAAGSQIALPLDSPFMPPSRINATTETANRAEENPPPELDSVRRSASTPIDSGATSRTESPQLVVSNVETFAASRAKQQARPPAPAEGGETPLELSPRAPAGGSLVDASGAVKGCLRKTPRPEIADFSLLPPSLAPTVGGGSGGSNAAAPQTTVVQFADPEATAVGRSKPSESTTGVATTTSVRSPPALRSRDGSIVIPGKAAVRIQSLSALGVPPPSGHARTGSFPASSPSTGAPLFSMMDQDHLLLTSDDDMLGTLNAITVTSIHSATASPGGNRIAPPRRIQISPRLRPDQTAAYERRVELFSDSDLSSPTADRGGGASAVTAAARVLPPRALSKEDLDAETLSRPPNFDTSTTQLAPGPAPAVNAVEKKTLGGGGGEGNEDDTSSTGSGQVVHMEKTHALDSEPSPVGTDQQL